MSTRRHSRDRCSQVFPVFHAHPLPCIILNANQRTKNGRGLGTRLAVRYSFPSCGQSWDVEACVADQKVVVRTCTKANTEADNKAGWWCQSKVRNWIPGILIQRMPDLILYCSIRIMTIGSEVEFIPDYDYYCIHITGHLYWLHSTISANHEHSEYTYNKCAGWAKMELV